MKNYPLYKAYNYVNIRELLEDAAFRHGNNIAYSYRVKASDAESVKVSFTQLAEDVRALATSAVKLGMKDGNVAVIGKLSYGWVCTYLALLSVGAVIVPLDADWSAEELASTVKVAECTTLFCGNDVLKSKADIICREAGIKTVVAMENGECEHTLRGLIDSGSAARLLGDTAYECARISPDMIALLVFTSGTTGKGKGVMLSQTAIVSDITSGLSLIEGHRKTIGLLPPHHTFGSTVSILGNLIIGAEVYISSGLRYIMRELKEERPEHLVMVPLYLETFRRKILDTARDTGKEKALGQLFKISAGMSKAGIDLRRRLFSSILAFFGGKLKFVICGGAPLSSTVADFFEAMGIRVLNGYGITECAPLISVNRNRQTKEGSVGHVIPIDRVKIKDPNEQGDGEICVKGPNVMLGYYKDPEATDAAFDNDGYFLTGDYGHLDSEGWLYITGRLKNLIILSNGKNVYPEEIETELSDIPGIADVVVYEGISRTEGKADTIVAEIYPSFEYLEKNGIEDAYSHFNRYVTEYNRNAVPYKKVGALKIRETEFPKNTLRKIMRFKLDRSID